MTEQEIKDGYKYFLEDTRTGLWWKLRLEPIVTSEKVSPEEYWTNDPERALQFDSVAEADDYNNTYLKWSNVIVTEHEFITQTKSK